MKQKDKNELFHIICGTVIAVGIVVFLSEVLF